MPPRAMRPGDRRARLVQVVDRRGGASVEELADYFDTSRETIRRDLQALSEAGRLLRVHGAAKPQRLIAEDSFRERMSANAAAKRTIAQLAVGLVDPGDAIFLDTGSTTLYFAQQLKAVDNLTVITNSSVIADVAARGNDTAQIFLLGGRYHTDNRETYGPPAIAQLGTFYARRAFLTIAALDAGGGAMDVNFEEAEVAKAMIARAEELVILADSSKFDTSGPFTVSALDGINYLVTEKRPPKGLREALRAGKVRVVHANSRGGELDRAVTRSDFG